MVAHYYRELLNYLARALNDRDAAADLTQESYARVIGMQRSGTSIGDMRAVLFRTARNLVIDRHRRSRTRAPAHAGDAPDAVDEAMAPRALEPEAAASSAQAVEAMVAAIAALPLRCREAFILHKFDGLSQAEVAQAMGISVKMVERHIKSGMLACRRCRERLDAPPGHDRQ
ncbi:putative RNA polymerase sigma factor FecI [Pigmentiphaga humi]|uniref:Putative RNA polymerase sigma factor FecI n=1 Tax=Pigmentiphaga humi TaxID=2478468 RepID=A0A3P4B353_9BURK|nr:sigma-70 family RNA polymerase sigma factor [Pigmentiphaga humi]VCU70068.1 putative RNA polymerase sigma factor FecI [Pigmentiphaga humi]